MTSIETRMLDRELKKGSAEVAAVLARQRDTWKSFVHAMRLLTGVDHA